MRTRTSQWFECKIAFDKLTQMRDSGQVPEKE